MKKNLLWAASLACLCASCASDAIVEENHSSEEIRFRAFTEGSTRADKVYCPTVKPGQFNVYAYTATETGNGDLIIDGDLIKDENNDGNYVNSTMTRYWPQTGDLYFNAVLNHDSYTAGAVAFEVANEVASQKDLIYARTKASKQSTPVALNFRHALSQIVFNAKNSDESLTITINSVTIKNVYSKGTYTLPTGTNVTDGNIDHTGTADDHVGTDKTDASRGTWGETPNTLKSYTVTLATPKVLSGKVDDAVAISSANATDALMLIPGSYTKWDLNKANKDSQAYFVLNVKIEQKKVNSTTETAAVIWNGNVAIPVEIEWQEGKRYVYTFAFGNGNGGVDPENPDKPVFVPINFSVTVDEFVPETSDVNTDATKEENKGGNEGGEETPAE